jgi:hypothetical protein
VPAGALLVTAAPSPARPSANAPAAFPAASPPASGVGAVARQPINAHLFSAADLAEAREVESLMQQRVVVPSQSTPWRGRRDPGLAFTHPQQNMMRYLGIDGRTCETLYVSSSVGMDEVWVNLGDRRRLRVIFTCPILGRRAPDQIKVLSAGGSKKWVYADGSITKATARGR